MPEGIGPLPSVSFVLGGARSGKSAYAEGLILRTGLPGLYLATAEAGLDAEMTGRIAAHRARRGAVWTTIEEPLDLAPTLLREARPDRPILVDCLTLWLSNLLHVGRDVDAATLELVAVLGGVTGPVVLVSNEVGLGIVPDNALARAFRDHAGRLHQAVAAVAAPVVFMVAGQPMVVKPSKA